MIGDARVDEFRADLATLLQKYGWTEQTNFVMIVSDLNADSHKIDTDIIMRDNCGTCVAMMVNTACLAIEEGLKNGELTVHPLPAMYGNTGTLN